MRILIVAFSVALLASGQNAASATKTPPASTATKKASATKRRRSTAKKPQSTAANHTSSTSKTTKRTPARPAVVKQQQPTPERYKEIQQALADKGYFSGTPDGTWGSESVDALKRFQREQNLEPDGKIGSLSLIALGLGPKREAIQ